jgi:hypothetical protein
MGDKHFLVLFLFYLFIFNSFVQLFTCSYIVWVIYPPCPLPPPLLPLPNSGSGTSHSALVSDFVEEKTQA